LAKAAFQNHGLSKADIDGAPKSGQAFEAKIAEIQKRDSCTRIDAMSKARKEDPEGFKAFQGGH